MGAGPTGLVLALWLTRLGVACASSTRPTGPGTTSRALVVHARTLELYRQLGSPTTSSRAASKFAAVNLWARGRHAARVAFGDIGGGLSPLPVHRSSSRRTSTSACSSSALARAGVAVERRDRAARLRAKRATPCRCALRRADGAETTLRAAYLAGCDGAHSRVRELIGIGFPGGTYAAPVLRRRRRRARARRRTSELHVDARRRRLPGGLPAAGRGAARLVGTVRRDADGERELGWDDVSTHAIERMQLDIERSTGSRPIACTTASPGTSAAGASSCSATPRTSTARSAARG